MNRIIEVVNIKRVGLPSNPFDVRIDRASPLGNPFPIGPSFKGMTGRQVCIQSYEDAIYKCLSDKADVEGPLRTLVYTNVKDELNRIVDLHCRYKLVRLFCWCAPQPCHGDIIKDMVINIRKIRSNDE